jgi:hypothetical protein
MIDVCFWHLADIPAYVNLCPLLGVKQTSQTTASLLGVSIALALFFWGKETDAHRSQAFGGTNKQERPPCPALNRVGRCRTLGLSIAQDVRVSLALASVLCGK